MKRFVTLLFAICCVCVAAFSQTCEQPRKPKSEHFTEMAYLPRATARTPSHFDVWVNGYSSDAETQRLPQTVIESGQEPGSRRLTVARQEDDEQLIIATKTRRSESAAVLF